MPCEKPIQIINPNYGKDPTKGVNYLKDCVSKYINVPCGHCGTCVALQQMELVQRIQMESLKNYIFMGTVTYRDLMLPRIDIGEYQYRYAKTEDMTLCIKRLRNDNAFGIPFRELYVSERGSKYARPHFHILFLFKKEDIGNNYLDILNFEQEHKWTLFKYWQRNIGTNRTPIYIDLSKYVESWTPQGIRKTYDFHYVDPTSTDGGASDVAFYVLKYMLKGEDVYKIVNGKKIPISNNEQKIKGALFSNYDEAEAKYYWDIIKSREHHSLGFGLNVHYESKERNVTPFNADFDIIDYIKGGVQRSKKTQNYPLFYHPDKLITFPLARYYRNFNWLYDDEDAYEFYKNSGRIGGMPIDDNRTGDEIIKKMERYYKTLKIQEHECVADEFDKLLEE